MTAAKLPGERVYRFGDVLVDGENFRIQKGGETRLLGPRAFDLLVYLIAQRGRVVEKQELFEQVWKDAFVTDNALTKAVKEIRRALGDDADAPRYIETVPRRGYRFIAEVTQEAAIAPAAGTIVPAAPSASLTPAAARRFTALPSRWLLTGVALIGVAILVAIGWRLLRGPGPREDGPKLRQTQVTAWPGLDIYPALAPNGHAIAYSSDHSGGFDIYVKLLAPGSREIQITADGQQNFEPAWSPDGQYLAYYSMQRRGICVVPATGGRIRQITAFGSRPAWSPDGKQVAFQTYPITELGANGSSAMPPSTIWVVGAEGGEPTPVTQVGNPVGGHGSPSWSPDGKRIAFCASGYILRAVWTVSSQGGDLQEVAPLMAYDPVYAPDGQGIYYGQDSGLYRIRVSAAGAPVGEPVEIISPSPAHFRHFTVSADGKKIAYTSLLNSSNIWSVAVSPATAEANGPPVALTQDKSFRNLFPAWSPDGQKIAFQSWRIGGVSNIWLMDADGQNSAQVTTGGAVYPSWFPDGERIAYLNRQQGPVTALAIDLKTGQEKPLFAFTEIVEYMRLSPDGKRIVFNSNKDGPINTAVIAAEGGEARQLTFDKELMGFACWSPDGQALAMQIQRGEDTYVAVMPSAGGEIAQLTFDKGQSWVYSFSPDGDRIAFAGFRKGYWNVWWVSRSTRQQKQVTNYAKLNAYVRYPAWSPHGDRIAYEYAEATGNIWLMELK